MRQSCGSQGVMPLYHAILKVNWSLNLFCVKHPQKLHQAPEHVRVWNVISQCEHFLQEPMEGTDLASTPENQKGIEQCMFARVIKKVPK